MFSLAIFILGVLIHGTSSISFTSLPAQINATTKTPALLQVTVSELANSTLSWVVGMDYVINVSVVIIDNVTTTETVQNVNESIYSPIFEVKGEIIEANLKINVSDTSLDGKTIKLTDGTQESNSAAIRVTVSCGQPPESAEASCSSPTCKASLKVNETIEVEKYRMCNKKWTCGESGTWTEETESCSPIFCNIPGMSGEECDVSCGAGCPGDAVKTCASNGTCVDDNGAVVGCKDGYSGAKCDTDVVDCKTPPNNATSSCTIADCEAQVTLVDTSVAFKKRTCTYTYTCSATSGSWSAPNVVCANYTCREEGTYGDDCTMYCSQGCPGNLSRRYCDVEGRCTNPDGSAVSTCLDGYKGEKCDIPICSPQDCNGGECLAPGLCGNCEKHFAAGPTCRNIRLDGFLKGALPSLGVLAVIVIILTTISNWHIRRKIKET